MEGVGSIPENHSNMTKFATESDVGFKRVSSQIRRWIEEIKSSEPGRQAVFVRYSQDLIQWKNADQIRSSHREQI